MITDITYRADGAGYLKPGYTHIYVDRRRRWHPRQLTFGAFNEGGQLSWAPDGSYLVVTGNRNENWRREPVNTEVYRIALADGQITQLTKRPGPDSSARVSPDGKTIAYLSFEDKFMGYQNVELNVMNADGSNPRSLTASLDRSIDDVQWAPNGRDLYIRYDDHAVTKVARVALNGKLTPGGAGTGGSSARPPLHRRRLHDRERRHDCVHQRLRRAAVGYFHFTRRSHQTTHRSQRRLAARQDAGPGATPGTLTAHSLSGDPMSTPAKSIPRRSPRRTRRRSRTQTQKQAPTLVDPESGVYRGPPGDAAKNAENWQSRRHP